MFGVKSIRILVETFSFYQFRGSTPSFVWADKWDLCEGYGEPNFILKGDNSVFLESV